jgi:transcription elongation factor SPT6
VARSALAEQIAVDPNVRQSLRQIFMQNATVSTYPTAKGLQEVDSYHPARIVLSIEHKPLASFLQSRFLEIEKVFIFSLFLTLFFFCSHIFLSLPSDRLNVKACWTSRFRCRSRANVICLIV